MTRATVCLAAAVAVLVATPGLAWACPACGNPTLPQLPTGTGSRDSGTVSLSAALQTTALWVSHPAGCADLNDCDEFVVQPAHTHELMSLPVELRASVQWAVSSGFGIEGALPFRTVLQRASYETPGGGRYEPLDAGVHHRNEVVAGLADAQLRLRGLLVVERVWVTLRAGTSLPFGSTVEDPFELGDRGERHQHVQLGTGTFDPAIGADVTRAWASAQLSVYGSGQFALYDNRRGFRAGARGNSGLSVGWKARPGLLPYGLLEGTLQGADRWKGEIRQDGLLGRRELRVGLGVRWTTGRTTIDAALRAPVARHFVQGDEETGDLRAPLSASLSAGWTLGGTQ